MAHESPREPLLKNNQTNGEPKIPPLIQVNVGLPLTTNTNGITRAIVIDVISLVSEAAILHQLFLCNVNALEEHG